MNDVIFDTMLNLVFNLTPIYLGIALGIVWE